MKEPKATDCPTDWEGWGCPSPPCPTRQFCPGLFVTGSNMSSFLSTQEVTWCDCGAPALQDPPSHSVTPGAWSLDQCQRSVPPQQSPGVRLASPVQRWKWKQHQADILSPVSAGEAGPKGAQGQPRRPQRRAGRGQGNDSLGFPSEGWGMALG